MQLRFMGYGAFALFCAWSFVNFGIHNFIWLKLGDVAILAGILMPVVLFGWAALFVIERLVGTAQMPRWFMAASAVAFLLFHYPEIMAVSMVLFRSVGVHLTPLYGYALAFLGLPAILLVVANRPVLLRFTFVFAVAAIGTAVLEIAWVQVGASGSGANEPVPDAASSAGSEPGGGPRYVPSAVAETSGPNVYHIITDGYARADQLKKILGFDNSDFLNALEDRGFRVIEKAMANYSKTVFSMASMLSMDYPYSEKDTYKDYDRLTDILNGPNAVQEGLWERGYMIGLGGGGIWSQASCPDHPRIVCLTHDRQIVGTRTLEIASAVNRMTPFSYFVSVINKIGHVTTVSDVQEIIATSRLPEPVAVIVHTLPPHAPYTSKADCSDQSAVQFTLSGGLNKEKYLEALQCANKRLLAFSDYLMEKDPNAIVIFHSDHGSRFLTDWPSRIDAWTKDAFDERFGVFLAVRAPKRCQDRLPEDFSLVDFYRFVFSCIDGTEPGYLPNRHYITTDQGFIDFGKLYRYPVGADGAGV